MWATWRLLNINSKIFTGILTYETLRFTASFSELSSSGLRRRNSHTLRAKSMSSSWWTPPPKKSASYHQNPKLSDQNGLLDKCHLMLDILKPATGATRKLPSFLPFEWLFRVHPTEERSRAAERGEDAALVCPWARARGREDAAGPQRITAPIAAPCHTQTWQSYSKTAGSLPTSARRKNMQCEGRSEGGHFVYPASCAGKAWASRLS